MSSAAVPLLDADQARAGDEAAVAAGDTWAGLMERAAGHLARGVVAAAGGRASGRRVVLLVGKGNNGGDGWAASRRLTREHGAHCTVVAVDGVDTPASEEAAANRAAWIDAGGRTVEGTDHLDELLADADVAVDCLLGTGSSGAPRGAAGEAAEALRRAHGLGTVVVACDLPSGVSADDGSAAPTAVIADVTVTFGAVKRGLLLHPAAVHTGRLLLGSLGATYDRHARMTARWFALTPHAAAPETLPAAADKRARGAVLAVAGAAGTTGAAALAAEGALRSGAGLVTVATPERVRGEVAARVDAGVMVRGLPETVDGACTTTPSTRCRRYRPGRVRCWRGRGSARVPASPHWSPRSATERRGSCSTRTRSTCTGTTRGRSPTTSVPWCSRPTSGNLPASAAAATVPTLSPTGWSACRSSLSGCVRPSWRRDRARSWRPPTVGCG